MDLVLVRARFLLTAGHLVATCLLEMEAASVVAYLSFALAFGCLFAGVDTFSPSKNAIHILCHFLGGVIVSRIVLQSLDPGRYLWCVVVVAHLPSSLCSLGTIMQLFLLKTARHSY